MKIVFDFDSSAAQPARKKQRATGEVLQNPPANESIGFISCPENMQVHTNEGLQKLKEAVAHVIDLGSIFISVTCEQTKMNMRAILNQSEPLLNAKIKFNDTQPEVFLTASALFI